jgi:predicted secreted protein
MLNRILLFIILGTSGLVFSEEQQSSGTILNLSATERLELQEDLLIANLRVEKEGANPKNVQTEINQLMEKAVKLAKSVPEVSISTEQYYIYQYNIVPNEPAKIWHGNQVIQLKSTSSQDLLKLVGQLQDIGLLVQGLNYTNSPAKIEEVRDSMMETTIQTLRKKAERTAKALGLTNIEILEINIDANIPFYPRPMMMNSMRSKAEAATPVAEPGKNEVTMTISAKILMK